MQGGNRNSRPSNPSTPTEQRKGSVAARNFPLSPESEQRRRVSVDKKKKQQRNYRHQNNTGSTHSHSNRSIPSASNHSASSSNLSNNNSGRIDVLELESLLSMGDESVRSNVSVLSSGSNSRQLPPERSCRQRAVPKMKRFGKVMAMSAVFCIIVLLRERHLQDENSLFKFGLSESNEEKMISIDSSGDPTLKHALGTITSEPIPTPLPTTMSPTSHPTTTTPALRSNSINKTKPESVGLADFSYGDDEYDSDDYSDDQAFVQTDSTQSTGNNNNMSSHPLEWQTLEEQQQQQIVQEISKQQEPPPQQQSATKEHSNMPLRYPLLPIDTSNNNTFVRKHCDLQGTDWFPYDQELMKNMSNNVNANNNDPATLIPSWHQRAPFIMLLGPPNGGSDVVYQLLKTHPQVADAMESHFFTFNHKIFVANSGVPNATIRVRTRAARQAYMARHVSTKRQLEQYPSEIVIDNVPETLLYSKNLAPFVMCVMPWVKLVITVSHPVRRLLKHYEQATSHGLTLSLEDWIARDLERMQEAGLLIKTYQNGTSQTKLVPGTNHEAWNKYQQLTPTAMEASAGQSLYEFMVHPWFTWMEQMGRNPQTEILLVQRELLVQHNMASDNNNKVNPRDALVQEYQRIVERLGLAPHTPPESTVQQILALQEKHSWMEDMDKTTRRHLRKFFKPYNERFDQFLESYYYDKKEDGLTATNNSLLHWDPALWQV